MVDGLHEALVSEEVWEQAVKVAAQAKKYEKVNRDKKEKIHLLSGILKCPVLVPCTMNLFCPSSTIGDFATINRILYNPSDKSSIK